MDSLSFSCSLLDSSHGGSYGKDERFTPLEKQYKFFGKLQFPVKTDIDAWAEKVSFTIKKMLLLRNIIIICFLSTSFYPYFGGLCNSNTSLSVYLLLMMIWFIHFIGLLFLTDKKASVTAYCQGVSYGCSVQLGC